MTYRTDFTKKELPKNEEDVLAFWESNHIFQKSIDNRSEDKRYFFYDGPPFATGTPHYGHILASIIKDVVPRYYTMLGYKIERRFGWDCHGLPVEFEAEKELGTKGRYDIEQMGIDTFNEYCRSIVMRYAAEWRYVINRIGRWIDLDNDYKTLDVDFMESVWWVFKTLWDKGLIYRDMRITAYSSRLSTPLSNFEVSLGYRETADPSVTVKFRAVDEPDTFFLGWTTTPWTLPSNLALCVNPDMTYVLVEQAGERYYLGQPALERYAAELGDARICSEFKGSDLENKRYQPLFPYFSEHTENGAFIVTVGAHVTADAGTGIVHTAPMFGEDDYKIGRSYNLPVVLPINESGEFTAEAGPLEGLFFKDADKPIIQELKKQHLMFRHEQITHNYPFCWRTDTPLMYRGIPSWFVNVDKIKSNMLDNNRQIHYTPGHIRDGRMGKWLEGARDWCISRNRFWGTPLPVWICERCEHQHCLGSREELEAKTGAACTDLHRHFIDNLTISCEKCGGTARRISEVLDCWFESGSMPYAQLHYPFENKARFETDFPADFISEGIDQTRGWFYTLSVLSSALLGVPAYKNIIVSGLLLAENGEKMSKRLKNYPDPLSILAQHGADAVRLYLLSSTAVKAEEMKFSEKGVIEINRSCILPLHNVLSFFVTYANIDGWKPNGAVPQPKNPLDIWILSTLSELIETVRQAMAEYDLNRAVQPLVGFVDALTNWYIRRSRRRFWKAGETDDKHQAYETLYFVLMHFAKAVAPFIPFTAELVYDVLKSPGDPESVHLCDYPEAAPDFLDASLNEDMQKVITAVGIGRYLRSSQQIKIRQPLDSVSLVSFDEKTIAVFQQMQDQIMEELNVKKVLIERNEAALVSFSARPNLPRLGPKYGKQMKALTEAIKALPSEALNRILKGSAETVTLNGEPVTLRADDLIIDRHQKPGVMVESRDGLIVAMDTKLSPELIREGLAREVINRVQNLRKEADFNVTDRIEIGFTGPEEVSAAVEEYTAYISRETLAEKIVPVTPNPKQVQTINGFDCTITVTCL